MEQVAEIGRRVDATPGQVALAWVLAQGDDVVPIPGTKRVAHLDENPGAADVQLPPHDVAPLDALPPPTRCRY